MWIEACPVCAVVLAAVLLQPVAADAADNLAPNPGFELEDAGEPAFWQQRTPGDAARKLTWVDGVARSGARSLCICNEQPGLSRWRTGHLRDIVLQPGTEARFSAWVRTRGVLGAANLRLYVCNEKGDILLQPGSNTVAADTDWTQLHVSATVPAEPSYAMLYLELKGAGTAWFDDVTLTGTLAENRAILAAPAAIHFGPEDMWDLTGYQKTIRDGRPAIQLPPDATDPTGQAALYFPEETARYDITLTYFDEFDGACTLRVVLNGEELGKRVFDAVPADAKDDVRTWTLPGVDVQRNSKLVLIGRADQGEYCRITRVSFTRVGRFAGTLLPAEQLPACPALLVYRTQSQRRSAAGMLNAFVNQYGTSPAVQRREARLARLQTPEDWRAYQETVREHLGDHWGPFPLKTPLNARTVGVIDREKFTIEKVVYESRPRYYVTANFYCPKGRKFPVPGVILVCGHASEGKGYHLYHECSLGLVLKGYAVLAIDPTGQGERSEYFDPTSLQDTVSRTVAQHWQLGRPSFLVGQTLGGYRTWDAIRGVDYLLTRPEVDAEKLAAVGNSGGGQMSFLVTAADERIDVCVAAHPGGSMENTYFTGWLADRDVLALIPPRPCRVIVGTQSGESYHQTKVDDMLRFYKGLGYDEARCELKWADGVHDMKRPKREPTYEWLNRWFGKEEEGWQEPALEPLSAADLWCTETGYALKSLGGETGRSLNAKRMGYILPQRRIPADRAQAQAQQVALHAAVTSRVGLHVVPDRLPPEVTRHGTRQLERLGVELLEIVPEHGIRIPAALLTSAHASADAPIVIHAAERGKPIRVDRPSLPVSLCRAGLTVLCIDVRGTGETDAAGGRFASTANGYHPAEATRSALATNAYGYMGRSMPAMRAVDIIRACDYVRLQPRWRNRQIVVVGEGIGGLWALLAGACDSHIAAVVTVNTLASLRMLIEAPLYEVRGYFYMPHALQDFDIPELAVLVAPRPVTWIDPVDSAAHPVAEDEFRRRSQWTTAMCSALSASNSFVRTGDAGPDETAAALLQALALDKPR